MTVGHSLVEDQPTTRRRVLRLRTGTTRVGVLTGLGILVAMVLMSVLAPVVTGHTPDEITGAPYSAPSSDYWFGTDALGRDVFVRTFVAVRIDYLIASLGVVVSLVVGSLLGVLVGIARSPFWGALLMRVSDALIAVPFTLVILLIVVLVGADRELAGLPRGVAPVLVAVFLVGWAVYARLARAETLSLRQRDFITAARLMGFSRRRLVVRHVLPAVIRTNGAYAVSDSVLIVGFVAALPFLGAGVAPPTAEWGSMIFEGRGVLSLAWWVVSFPGAALLVTAAAVALVADGLLSGPGGRGPAH